MRNKNKNEMLLLQIIQDYSKFKTCPHPKTFYINKYKSQGC